MGKEAIDLWHKDYRDVEMGKFVFRRRRSETNNNNNNNRYLNKKVK